jgi:hypothetical protein
MTGQPLSRLLDDVGGQRVVGLVVDPDDSPRIDSVLRLAARE